MTKRFSGELKLHPADSASDELYVYRPYVYRRSERSRC